MFVLLLAGTVHLMREDHAPSVPMRTVFIGDSITQGDSMSFDLQPGERSWVRYAVTDPGSPWRFQANVAVGGQTLEQMEARFALDVLERHPQAVVIMGGTNDVLRGQPLGPAMDSLRSMVVAADAAGARVWIVAPPPISHIYGVSITPLTEAEAALAADLRARFVDPAPAVTGPDGDWLPGLTTDGVHPTPEGAQRLAAAVIDGLAAGK